MKEETKTADVPMKIKMALQPGPVVRVIDGIEWSAGAGWVQEVPIDLAANLLAYPHPGWSLGERPSPAARKALAERLGVAPENIVAPGEPVRFGPSLADVVGRERAGQLAEMGIGVKKLAALTAGEITDLAFRTGATAAEIGEWVVRANA